MRKASVYAHILIACVVAFVVQLFLHEVGHLVFAILTGNSMTEMNFGSTSYVGISVANQWSVPLISLGAFILPIAFSLLVHKLFSKKTIISLFSAMVLAITLLQIVINAIAINCGISESQLATFDLGIFVKHTNFNEIIVGAISLIIAVALAILIVKWLSQVSEELA